MHCIFMNTSANYEQICHYPFQIHPDKSESERFIALYDYVWQSHVIQ